MLKLKQAIVVEGRYDKIKLESLVDTEIFTTEGFGVFKDEEKMSLLRRVAEKRGLIVFTDADGAGLVIRNRLRQCIPEQYLLHAYIPDLPGKERRKIKPSKEGTLGVEGVDSKVILHALQSCGATEENESVEKITKADLAAMGLSGCPDSAQKRKVLQFTLALPQNLSANALLNALNALYSREDFMKTEKNF